MLERRERVSGVKNLPLLTKDMTTLVLSSLNIQTGI